MINDREIYSHSYLVLEVITVYLDQKKKKKNHVWVPDLVQRQAGWKEVVNPEKKNLSDPLLENLFLILITTKQFLSPWKYIK